MSRPGLRLLDSSVVLHNSFCDWLDNKVSFRSLWRLGRFTLNYACFHRFLPPKTGMQCCFAASVRMVVYIRLGASHVYITLLSLLEENVRAVCKAAFFAFAFFASTISNFD